jgi:mono/diheme cytochrome c family protein
MPMNTFFNLRVLGIVLSSFLFCFCVRAQTSVATQAAIDSQSGEIQQGKSLLQSKCAQCHTDSIWRDQRQDARAWEATLYRMMGRGAVWSGSDIHAMASYLATDFGPQSPRVFTPQ